ncbi:MAG: hypothetical protein V5A39_06150 [Haloarculaceae archaeon]
METACPHIYEIEFDVLGQRRDEYDAWLETDALEWISHEAVDEFEVLRHTQNLAPRVRFVFEFRSIHRWADFIVSEQHKRSMDCLHSFTAEIDVALWQRSSLRLDSTSDSTQRRSTTERINDTDSNTEQVCPQN